MFYKSKVIVDMDAFKEYISIIEDLIHHDAVKSMNAYIQHGDTTCLEHSLHVSYTSYKLCKYFKRDYHSAARGALLHDFFLYDWHISGHSEGLHGFSHPRVALRNAKYHFEINTLEEEIIIKHMWPLTLKPPLKSEAFLVSMADKYCTIREVFSKKHHRFFDMITAQISFKV